VTINTIVNTPAKRSSAVNCRMAKMGQVTPDLWMENAAGKPVGPEPLLAATEKALGLVSSQP